MRPALVLSVVIMLVVAACDQTGSSAREGAVFRAQNGFLVHDLGDGRFEVIPRGSAGSRDFFCAAGDYAQRRLGAQPAARVVLDAPVGPSINNPGGRSAKFRVQPPGTASQRGLTVNMRRSGENLTVAHARTLCNRSLPGFFPD